jgi:hypothetical protein
VPVPVDDLQAYADACVRLVAEQHGRLLTRDLASLEVLDEVCRELVAEGPLGGDRLEFWTALVGAYTGEVLVTAYDGVWVDHDDRWGVTAFGVVGFPFVTARRLLGGETGKSLASMGRVLPAMVERREAED